MAALLVVLFHLRSGSGSTLAVAWSRFATAGYSGVDVFFVLSGFIIYYVHRRELGQPRSALSFCRSRIQRVVPMYWLVVGIKCLLVSSQHLNTLRYSASDILISLLLLPISKGQRVLSVSWSMTCEFIFYGIFLLAILLPRRSSVWLLGAWTVLILAAIPFNLGDQTSFGFDALSVRNLGFVLGIGVAWLLDRRMPSARLAQWTVRAGVVVFVAAFALADATQNAFPLVLRTPGFTVGGTLILYGLVALERQGRVRTPRLLVFLGNASYSIYLTHIVAGTTFLALLTRLHSKGVQLALPILVPVLAIGVGCLAYAALERPLLRLVKRRRVMGDRSRWQPTSSAALR